MRLTHEMETIISSSTYKDDPMYSHMAWNSFTFFDKKPLDDLDCLMGNMAIGDYEWEKKKSFLIWWTKEGLLHGSRKENGSLRFPRYTRSRIQFFDKLIEKWHYNIRNFKRIAASEDALIDALYYDNEFFNKNLSDFEFYLLFLKRGAEDDERLLKSKENLPKRDLIEDNFEQFKKLIEYFEQNKYENLAENAKNQIAKIVSSVKGMMGDQMIRKIINYRSKCLLGFSPNVEFQNNFSADVANIGDVPRDEYPYVYKDGHQKYYFGNWAAPEEFLIDKKDFFATPEFLIEYGFGNGVHINIRDPEKVESHYMRRINKFYTKVRKGFRPQRKAWGEKSGIKKTFEKRNKNMRDLYEKLRVDKPEISADKKMEEVLESIANGYENITVDTVKRIIYSSKNE